MEWDKKVKFHSTPIKLNDIAKLKKADLLIELNVLHHAGSFYDQRNVSSVGDWRKYAINRLLEIDIKEFFFKQVTCLMERCFFHQKFQSNIFMVC